MSNSLLKKNIPIISLFALWHWMVSPNQLLLFHTKYKTHSLCISDLKQSSLSSFTNLKIPLFASYGVCLLTPAYLVINLSSNIRNIAHFPSLSSEWNSQVPYDKPPLLPYLPSLYPPLFLPYNSVDANYIYPSIFKVLKFHNTPMKTILYRNKLHCHSSENQTRKWVLLEISVE